MTRKGPEGSATSSSMKRRPSRKPWPPMALNVTEERSESPESRRKKEPPDNAMKTSKRNDYHEIKFLLYF